MKANYQTVSFIPLSRFEASKFCVRKEFPICLRSMPLKQWKIVRVKLGLQWLVFEDECATTAEVVHLRVCVTLLLSNEISARKCVRDGFRKPSWIPSEASRCSEKPPGESGKTSGWEYLGGLRGLSRA